MADKELSFEEAIARLDELARGLEDGKAPLDESLKMFEEGVKLIGICKKQLDEAEQKVRELTEIGNGGDKNAEDS